MDNLETLDYWLIAVLMLLVVLGAVVGMVALVLGIL
jgi:hypothetical protein